MGTKNDPGQFDCHAAAEPDEPLFTLLARDPLAPHLVRMWAKARGGDLLGALEDYVALIHAAGSAYWQAQDAVHVTQKVREAEDCAAHMDDWREINRRSR
jgi:hypothetical protein